MQVDCVPSWFECWRIKSVVSRMSSSSFWVLVMLVRPQAPRFSAWPSVHCDFTSKHVSDHLSSDLTDAAYSASRPGSSSRRGKCPCQSHPSLQRLVWQEAQRARGVTSHGQESGWEMPSQQERELVGGEKRGDWVEDAPSTEVSSWWAADSICPTDIFRFPCIVFFLVFLSCLCLKMRQFHMKCRFPSSFEKSDLWWDVREECQRWLLQVWDLSGWNKGTAFSWDGEDCEQSRFAGKGTDQRCIRCIKFEVRIKHPGENVEEVSSYRSWEFRRETGWDIAMEVSAYKWYL